MKRTGRRKTNASSIPPTLAICKLLVVYIHFGLACLAYARSFTSYEVVLSSSASPDDVWRRNGLSKGGEMRHAYKSKHSFLIAMEEGSAATLSQDHGVLQVSKIGQTGVTIDTAGTRKTGRSNDTGLWLFDTPVIDNQVRTYCKRYFNRGEIGSCQNRDAGYNWTKTGNLASLRIVSNSFYDEASGEQVKVITKAIQTQLEGESDGPCQVKIEFRSIAAWDRVFEIRVEEGPAMCRAVDVLKNITGVARIEFADRMELLNNFAASVGQSGLAGKLTSDAAVIWKEGIMGQGEVVAVGDSGLDVDSCFFREAKSSAPEFKGCDLDREKVVCYIMGESAEFGDTKSRLGGGHGTHVAGTVAGFHVRSLTAEDADNRTVTFNEIMESTEYANGMAPLARLAVLDIDGKQENSVDAPVDLSRTSFFTKPYEEAGVRLHSNSWGCAGGAGQARFCNKYDSQTRSIDEFMWRNKDFLVFFAAGNTGAASSVDVVSGNFDDGSLPKDPALRKLMSYQDGFFTVGAPATAKNCVSVGATSGSDNLYFHSSRGPTFDGRIKPDVVFPGDLIRSAYSSGNPTDFSEGLCGKQASDDNESTLRISGTSMACPGVAGIAALVRQYYREFNPVMGTRQFPITGPLKDGKGPSASLIKATLISSARSLSGFYHFQSAATKNIESSLVKDYAKPRQIEGFGLPALNNTLHFNTVNSSRSLHVFDRHSFSKTGESHKFIFNLKTGSTFKATLVYTDPPGPVTSAFDPTPVLINDLDLTASCTSGSCSAATRSSDPLVWQSVSRVDNVEQLPTSTSSAPVFTNDTQLTLVVIAFDLIQSPQPYALVVSGEGIGLDFDASQKANWEPDWRAEASVPGLFSSATFNPKIVYSCLGVAGVILLLVGVLSLRTWCRASGSTGSTITM